MTVQAQILAGSLAGPLAFDDEAATQEYVDALKANADILAVGAYDERGGRTPASRGAAPTAGGQPGRAAEIDDDEELVVTAPVVQNGTQLGSVYLRAALEPWTKRVMRYIGIGIVVSWPRCWSPCSARPMPRSLRRTASSRKRSKSAAGCRGGAAPVAEDGGDRPADRRRRARFQQSADADRRQPRPAAGRGLGGEREQRLIDGRAAIRRARQDAGPAPARLRAAPAAAAGRGRRRRADRRHARSVARTIGPQIGVVLDVAPDLPPAHGRPEPARARAAQPRASMRATRCPMAAAHDRRGSGDRSANHPGAGPASYIRLTVADTGRAWTRRRWRARSSPSSRPRASARAPGLACRWSMASPPSRRQLAIDSAPGAGTTVALWLPVDDERGPFRTARAAADPARAGGPVLAGRRRGSGRFASPRTCCEDAAMSVCRSHVGRRGTGLVDAGALAPDIPGYPTHLMPGMTGDGARVPAPRRTRPARARGFRLCRASQPTQGQSAPDQASPQIRTAGGADPAAGQARRRTRASRTVRRLGTPHSLLIACREEVRFNLCRREHGADCR